MAYINNRGQQNSGTQYNAGRDINMTTTYNYTARLPLDKAMIEKAHQKLELLPLETIPDISSMSGPTRLLYTPNPLFVIREQALKQLARLVKEQGTPSRISAVSGIGGVGKTQLVSEFVHRYGNYFAGGVFWLSFSDPKGIPTEIAACATAMRHELPPHSAVGTEEEQIRLVKDTWCNSPLPRLLIFDGCEEEGLLDAWVPISGECRVILTSLCDTWALERGVKVLNVSEMTREESVALLREYREDLLEQDAIALAHEVGHLPLALQLIGCVLKTYRATSIGNPIIYLNALKKNPLAQLDTTTERIHSVTRHTPQVKQTFALSYQRLQLEKLTDRSAFQILQSIVYLAPGEAIPRDLLYAVFSEKKLQHNADLLFENAINRLAELGLLERSGNDLFRVHRLICMFLKELSEKNWLLSPRLSLIHRLKFSQIRRETALKNTYDGLRNFIEKDGVSRNYYHIALLQKHACSMVSHTVNFVLLKGSDHIKLKYRDKLLTKVIRRLISIPGLSVAFLFIHLVGLFWGCIFVLVAGFTIHRVSTLLLRRSSSMVPDLLLDREYVGLKLELFLEAANLFMGLEAYEDAIQHTRECTQIYISFYNKKFEFPEHYITRIIENYQLLRQYELGEEFLKKCIGLKLAQHPNAQLNLLGWLTILYTRQGKYADAELLCQDALLICRSVEEHHPDLGLFLGHQAIICKVQEKYEQAEELFLQAIEESEIQLSLVYSQKEARLSTIKLFLWQLSRSLRGQDTTFFDLAYLKNLYKIPKNRLENPIKQQIIGYLVELGEIHVAQYQYTQAESYYRRGRDLVEQIQMLPDLTLNFQRLYANGFYLLQGQYQQAEQILQDCLAQCEQEKQSEETITPLLSQCLFDLAECYRRQQRYDEAEPLYEKALSIDKQILNVDDKQIPNRVYFDLKIDLLHGFALFCHARQRKEEGKAYYISAEMLCQRYLTIMHPQRRKVERDRQLFL